MFNRPPAHEISDTPLENAPRLRDVIRLTYTLLDAWMESYAREWAREWDCQEFRVRAAG